VQWPIHKVGIVGAGTMGGGIAMNFANAGTPTVFGQKTRAATTATKAARLCPTAVMPCCSASCSVMAVSYERLLYLPYSSPWRTSGTSRARRRDHGLANAKSSRAPRCS
jgi:hypothetical protein